MPIDIRVGMTGGRTVERRIEYFEQRFHGKLRAVIEALTSRLLSAVEAAEPERTGRLRRQTRQRIFERPNRISGRVTAASRRADALKAAALEYGSKRQIAVAAYTRGADGAVAAYTRKSNISAMRFLRGPFAEMRGDIEEQLQEALDETLGEINA